MYFQILTPWTFLGCFLTLKTKSGAIKRNNVQMKKTVAGNMTNVISILNRTYTAKFNLFQEEEMKQSNKSSGRGRCVRLNEICNNSLKWLPSWSHPRGTSASWTLDNSFFLCTHINRRGWWTDFKHGKSIGTKMVKIILPKNYQEN